MNKNPLVSVIMPVRNAGEFLGESIKSIINQAFQDFEFIIVNDGSSDNSLNIINKYKKLYPEKIRVVNLKKGIHKGGDACANYGYKYLKGEFIARMDADDVVTSDRLEKQVNFLKINPDIFLVGSNAYIIDKNGEIIGEKIVPSTHEAIYRNFFTIHPMINPSIMLRRKLLFKGNKLYNVRFKVNNDYLTNIKYVTCRRFANLSEKLIFYRIHGGNNSLRHLKSRFINTLKIRFEAIMKYGYQPSMTNLLMLLPQIFIVLLLPEKLVFDLLMFIRGMYKPKIQMLANFSPIFAKIKTYTLSLL